MNIQFLSNVVIVSSNTDRNVGAAIGAGVRSSHTVLQVNTWNMAPADSLLQTVINQGLQGCVCFVVIVSPSSLQNAWCSEFLSYLGLQIANLVPVVVVFTEAQIDVDVSFATQTVCLSESINAAVDTIAKAIETSYQAEQRETDSPSPYTQTGLSTEAASIVGLLLRKIGDGDPGRYAYGGKAISGYLGMTPESINSAVRELETRNYVRVVRSLGTSPFEFQAIIATHGMVRDFAMVLENPYDPDDDIRRIADAISKMGSADGRTLQEAVQITAARINSAVGVLENYGVVTTVRALGTMPYEFAIVQSTPNLQRFLKSY